MDTTDIAPEEATGLCSWLMVSGGIKEESKMALCVEADSHCACGQIFA